MQNRPYCDFPVVDMKATTCASCGYTFRKPKAFVRYLPLVGVK